MSFYSNSKGFGYHPSGLFRKFGVGNPKKKNNNNSKSSTSIPLLVSLEDVSSKFKNPLLESDIAYHAESTTTTSSGTRSSTTSSTTTSSTTTTTTATAHEYGWVRANCLDVSVPGFKSGFLESNATEGDGTNPAMPISLTHPTLFDVLRHGNLSRAEQISQSSINSTMTNNTMEMLEMYCGKLPWGESCGTINTIL